MLTMAHCHFSATTWPSCPRDFVSSERGQGDGALREQEESTERHERLLLEAVACPDMPR